MTAKTLEFPRERGNVPRKVTTAAAWQKGEGGFENPRMLQSMFATKTPCLSERINPRSADAPAFTAFEHGCLPVAAAQFWRADALEVASALPFEFDETLRQCRMNGTRI